MSLNKVKIVFTIANRNMSQPSQVLKELPLHVIPTARVGITIFLWMGSFRFFELKEDEAMIQTNTFYKY